MSDCRKCGESANQMVVLLEPDGERMEPEGDFPTCPTCTQSLISVLVPTYSDGEPAYRIERIDQ